MPLLTLHLLRLKSGQDPPTFLRNLRWSIENGELIVASRPRYPVVRSTIINKEITDKKWDLMLLLRSPNNSLPSQLTPFIEEEYKVTVGIPTKLLQQYPEKNDKLIKNAKYAQLTGSLEKARVPNSSQNLELSPELLKFMDELMKEHPGPVTMLNLLNFKDGGKPKYYQYGQNFINVAGKRGGDAKLVGNVVRPPQGQSDSRGDSALNDEEWWNEISIVHYPSIKHFCDMLAGEDYQEINEKYRLAALRDTLLICTTEFDVEAQDAKAKL